MKAQLIKEFGNPSVFTLSEIDKPQLKSGHVLIKVCATSVNQIDCKIRSGAVSAIAPAFPAVLHGDVAGVIVEVADDVKHFSGKMLAKANTYFGMSWSLTPIIAPAIGGYLQHYLNWEANFYFMAFYSFICMIFCYYTLTETLPKHRIQPNQLAWFRKWKILFTDKIFMTGAILLSIQIIILMLYYTTAPFVIQTQLHFDPAIYGEIMLLIGLSYLIGNIVNNRLLNYFHTPQLILMGLVGSLIVTIAMVIFTRAFALNIYIATIPIFCLFFWDGLIFSNLLTQCISQHRTFAGTAGSLLGGLINVIAGVVTAICTHLWNLHSLLILSVIYLVILVIALGLFGLYFRNAPIET
jgi:predicted MFS family arabinose efflux permease